jgi:hypothetical protein
MRRRIDFEGVIHYVVRFFDEYRRYPAPDDFTKAFSVSKRTAQQLLRRFYSELGE